jgi:hypothetical protein
MESEPVAAPDPEVAPAPEEATAPDPAEAAAAEADASPVAGNEDGVDAGQSERAGPIGDESVAVPPAVHEEEVAPETDPVVEKYEDPAPGGSVEPQKEPGDDVKNSGHPPVESALSAVTALMAGKGFRWLLGSQDLAAGFYGVPVLINVWSCKDKDLKSAAKWLRGLESRYSDHMVSVLRPANDTERSLTSNDIACDLPVRPIRSHGIDLDGAILDKLGAKGSPAAYVYNDRGEMVASHVGPLSAGSGGAKKIEAAFNTLMAPVLQMRRTR